MSRKFPADTHIQRFLEETYNKERDTRIAFHEATKHCDKPESKQFEVFKHRIEAAVPKPTGVFAELKKLKPKSYHRKVIDPEDCTRLTYKVPDEEPRKDMITPHPCVTDLIYDGFTKEEKGRYQYLRWRKYTIPENRYRYQLLSSWEYGWRLPDIMKPHEIKKPEFGRTRTVTDTFYTRNGIPGLQTSATY